MVSLSKALVVLLAMRNFDKSSGALRHGRSRARADRVGRLLKPSTTKAPGTTTKAPRTTTKAATTQKAGGGGGGGAKKGKDEWWVIPDYNDNDNNRLGEPCKNAGECSPGEQCFGLPSTTTPAGGRRLQGVEKLGTCQCTPDTPGQGQNRNGCKTNHSCVPGVGGFTCQPIPNSVTSEFEPCEKSVQCAGEMRCCTYQIRCCLEFKRYPAFRSGVFCED